MATYYVRSSGGSDANAGTSFGAAWATVQHGADTAVAGDLVLICADGVHTTAAAIDIDTNAGSATSRINFRGANATGTADGTRATIRASASIATGLLSFAAAADYTVWRDLILDGNSNAANILYGVAGSDGHIFDNVRITGATSHGVNMEADGAEAVGWIFEGCESDHNGGNGVNHLSANAGTIWWHGGSIHHNSGRGWLINRGIGTLTAARVYRNTLAGLEASNFGLGTSFHIAMNTFYANGNSGLIVGPAGNGGTRVYGNSFASNTGYGIKFGGMDVGYEEYNHFDSNTTADTDNASLLLPGRRNASGAPLFTSTTDGSEDFRPQAASPLIGAGPGGRTIGAMEPAAGGGSGGISRGRLVNA